MSEVSVEDRVLIRELYERFYVAANGGDPEGVKACFAQGGVISGYDGKSLTPEFSAANHVAWNKDPVAGTYQHHVTNVVVDPDPEGREDYRSVQMYFLVTGVWDPPYVIIRWSCSARDVVRFVDGRWRFVTRQIMLNHDSTGPHWDSEPAHIRWDFELNQAI